MNPPFIFVPHTVDTSEVESLRKLPPQKLLKKAAWLIRECLDFEILCSTDTSTLLYFQERVAMSPKPKYSLVKGYSHVTPAFRNEKTMSLKERTKSAYWLIVWWARKVRALAPDISNFLNSTFLPYKKPIIMSNLKSSQEMVRRDVMKTLHGNSFCSREYHSLLMKSPSGRLFSPGTRVLIFGVLWKAFVSSEESLQVPSYGLLKKVEKTLSHRQD